VVIFGLGQNLHAISLGYAIASLGFGLFRPGFTAGTSLAVTRAEQGEASGAVASINGAAFIFAPALGVLLYNWHEWVSFGIIVALCLAVFVIGSTSLTADEETTKDRDPA
jgi:predicted MFS family arabinose efflux permease